MSEEKQSRIHNKTATTLIVVFGAFVLMLVATGQLTSINEYDVNTTNIYVDNLPLGCGNITGAASNLCTIEDTTITNCSVTDSCPNIQYGTELDTNASTACAGTGVFLDGEGACINGTITYNATYDSLSSITDTNASTECSGVGVVLDGEGNCYNATDTWAGNQSLYYTASQILAFNHYNSTNPAPTYNATYDAKPDNVYNLSYEYWNNDTLGDIYINESGDTMTGNLNMSSQNITFMEDDGDIYDNGTCIIIIKGTTELAVCE